MTTMNYYAITTILSAVKPKMNLLQLYSASIIIVNGLLSSTEAVVAFYISSPYI